MNLRRRIVVFTVAAVVVGGSLTGWLPFDRLLRTLASPITSSLSRLGGSLRGQGEVSEVDTLRQEVARLKQLEAENQQLRQQLGMNKPRNWQIKTVEITSYQPDSVRQFVRINSGSDDGLKTGMVVVSGSNLVGVIKNVSKGSSEVMLATDADFRVLVITTDGKATGIVKGQPGGALQMERIPRDQKIASSDQIVTSGLDGDFPRGLIVGLVEHVNNSDESIFQLARLKPSFELKNLTIVSVLTSYE